MMPPEGGRAAGKKRRPGNADQRSGRDRGKDAERPPKSVLPSTAREKQIRHPRARADLSKAERRRRLRSKTPDQRGRPSALSSGDGEKRDDRRVSFGPQVVGTNTRLLNSLDIGDIVIFNGHALGGRGHDANNVAAMVVAFCTPDDPDKFVVELLTGENEATSTLVKDTLIAHEATHGPGPLRVHCRTECRSEGCKADKSVIHVKPAFLYINRQGKGVPPWVTSHLEKLDADEIRRKIAAQRSVLVVDEGTPPRGISSPPAGLTEGGAKRLSEYAARANFGDISTKGLGPLEGSSSRPPPSGDARPAREHSRHRGKDDRRDHQKRESIPPTRGRSHSGTSSGSSSGSSRRSNRDSRSPSKEAPGKASKKRRSESQSKWSRAASDMVTPTPLGKLLETEKRSRREKRHSGKHKKRKKAKKRDRRSTGDSGRKHSRRRSRSRSTCSSSFRSSRSSSSSSSFRARRGVMDAGERDLAVFSRRRPGCLLEKASSTIEACLPPRPAAARAEAPLAARWLEYLHTSKPFDVARDQAEAVALATSLDMLINGDYLRCGDLLTQRFKALELSTRTTWKVASQLELTEPRRALLTSRDVAQATKAAAQQSRLDLQVSGRKP